MSDRRGVFLDRDGTLMKDTGYPRDPDEVELTSNAAEAIRRLNEAGLPVIIITNQSGIARGKFTRKEFDAVQARVIELLEDAGARIDATYVCPHHPDVDGPCDCRKPGTGLYKQAADDLGLDLSRSFYVGDRYRDVAATEELGGTPVVVSTGAGGRDAPYYVPRVKALPEAVDLIEQAMKQQEKST